MILSKKSLMVTLYVALAGLVFFTSRALVAEDSSDRDITILFTNNNNGVLKHCGCPGNPHGSLAQRLTEIRRIRTSRKHVLLLDGGDLFPPDQRDDLKLSYFLNVIEKHQYDAIALGDQDFGKGYSEVKRLVKEGRLPYLAANLVDAETKKPVTKGVLKKNMGNIRCLIIGLVSPNAYAFLPEKLLEEAKKVEVLDPVKTVKEILAKEGGDADFICVLSHMGDMEDQELAKNVSGIHVIVGGHTQRKLEQPLMVGDTYILQAGKNNEFLGVFEADLDHGRLKNVRHELLTIDDHIKGAPDISEMVDEYYESQKNVLVLSGGSAAPFEAARCMTCHQSAHRTWLNSRHAHALDSLHHDTRRLTKDCLTCHATVIPSPPLAVNQKTPPRMKVAGNVHCMACHQVEFPKDQEIHKRPVVNVTKEWCIKCHTKKDSPNFNFEAYWAKIRHGL